MNEDLRLKESRAREQESRDSDTIDKTDNRSTTSTFSCSKKSEIGKLWSTVSSYETRSINKKIKLAEKLGLFQKLDQLELESLDIDENYLRKINDVIINVLAPILKLEHVLKMDHLREDLESWAFVNQPSQPFFVESESQTEMDQNTNQDQDEMRRFKEDQVKKLKDRIRHLKGVLKQYRENETTLRAKFHVQASYGFVCRCDIPNPKQPDSPKVRQSYQRLVLARTSHICSRALKSMYAFLQ